MAHFLPLERLWLRARTNQSDDLLRKGAFRDAVSFTEKLGLPPICGPCVRSRGSSLFSSASKVTGSRSKFPPPLALPRSPGSRLFFVLLRYSQEPVFSPHRSSHHPPDSPQVLVLASRAQFIRAIITSPSS